MGQYSQWLYHREIDHQLQAQLEILEQELHTLQEQAAQLEDVASHTDNPLLKAIAMQQSARALLEVTSTSSTQKLPIVHTDTIKQPSKSVSPALFGWSNLPNLDTQKMQLPASEPDTQKPETIRRASIPHSDVDLLPTDMATFIDTHAQTLPQIQVPNWLWNTALPTTKTDGQQSNLDERSNTSIQRWLERWGKQTPDSLLQEQQKLQEVDKNE